MKVKVTLEYLIDFPMDTLEFYSPETRAMTHPLSAVTAALHEDFDADDPTVFLELCTDGALVSVEAAS